MAPDYTPALEGDMVRDDALRAIRQRDFLAAKRLIDQAAELHKGDQNREACLWMVRARVASAQGNYVEADNAHRNASSWWARLDNADPEWVGINLFHWLRTAIMLKDPTMDVIYRLLLEHEEDNSKRRKYAALMMRHGRKAVIAYGLYERLKS